MGDNGNDGSRILSLGDISRQQRRELMRHSNEELLKRLDAAIKTIARLQAANHAMSDFLSDIAATIKVPIPQSSLESINAVQLLRDRIIQLVEFEKKYIDIREDLLP